MKYKVGDKVRVRKDLREGRSYSGVTALIGMDNYFGAVGTVESIYDAYYRLDVSDFWWSEEMLEEVDKMGNVKIKIAVDGNTVIAKMGKETGIARCSPEDEFDIFTGVRLAIDRLEEKCNPYGWLKYGVKYYVPNFIGDNFYEYYHYDNDSIDKKFISRGLVFKTKEEAVVVAKKMLAVLKESDSNA